MSKICVLIHGYLTDFHDFMSLPSALAPYYDQVILLTLPGHECKKNLKYFKLKNVINYVENEINQIIVNNEVDVIGFSLGGALAKYIAVKFPINKVALLSPAIKYFNLALFKEKIEYVSQMKKNIDKEEYAKEIAEFRKNDHEAFQFVMNNTFKKFNVVNGIEFCKIVNYITKTKDPILCPMLIVRGSLDELVPASVIKECYNLCINDDKQVYEITGIGHMLLRTKYEKAIIKEIKKFLIGE